MTQSFFGFFQHFTSKAILFAYTFRKTIMFYLYIYRKQGIFQGIKTLRGGVGTSSGQASAHATARDADGHNEVAGAAWQTP